MRMETIHIQRQIQHFEQRCKGAGLKVTHQRLEVYRELLGARDHPSAETLYKRLERRLPTLSLDTVYRTLATFEKLGLVHRLETAASQARYEVLHTRHHHFLCDVCGQVFDFFWPSFDTAELPSNVGEIGTVDHASVVVHGTCTACAQAQQEYDARQAESLQ
ncbi:ferric uptake regulator, Fur family [Desulfobulbus propionicus DSM 2032]|jgi:Fur family peroxide stress response transcriptional regulator|uniref:Ferric uptake regulator, Fur family n=2 Tax=Desulfobulbus propionicus TaxID=894 RepID=A0A7U3YNZ5_DESPD|nr:ferric uptake regulator, Fur family [Desulfobulbus propionicus DSM 2032]